jgi:hypothetical protein
MSDAEGIAKSSVTIIPLSNMFSVTYSSGIVVRYPFPSTQDSVAYPVKSGISDLSALLDFISSIAASISATSSGSISLALPKKVP